MNERFKVLTPEWEEHLPYILEDFHNMYNPKVVKIENEAYPYLMYFFGESAEQFNPEFKGSDAIFLARGKTLDQWEVYCGGGVWDATQNCRLWRPIVTAGDHDFDNCHAGDPTVVYKDGRFYMAYSAVGFCYLQDIDKYIIINNVMGAVSDDGIHFTKSEKPLLIWEQEYTQRWIAGEPMPQGTGSYHRPSLMYDESKWKLWFDYYLPGTFLSMGYAENEGDFLDSDGYKIINNEQNPQIRDWPNPTVAKVNSTYYTFADPPGYSEKMGPHRMITAASSQNGIDWKIEGRLMPEPDYGTHVPEAYTEETEDGTWLYIFYSWQDTVCFPNYIKLNYIRKFFKK